MRHDGSLVLLPGMAADERLFAPQQQAFPGLIVPHWIEPEPAEPISRYALRMASVVEPCRPALVGGASFGGIVAREMAAHLGVEACVLISSVRSPAELSWRLWTLRPLAHLGPDQLGGAAGCVSRWSAPSMPAATARQLERLGEPRSAFLRWASWAVLHWCPTPAAQRVRVLQIHGSSDRTFPLQYTRPDRIVRGGGHLLPMTHPEEVNDFLRRALAGLT
jgi:pimeloyl-ACP methyl ester carboxylesterase